MSSFGCDDGLDAGDDGLDAGDGPDADDGLELESELIPK
jgi:hypothetical protein